MNLLICCLRDCKAFVVEVEVDEIDKFTACVQEDFSIFQVFTSAVRVSHSIVSQVPSVIRHIYHKRKWQLAVAMDYRHKRSIHNWGWYFH